MIHDNQLDKVKNILNNHHLLCLIYCLGDEQFMKECLVAYIAFTAPHKDITDLDWVYSCYHQKTIKLS